jgi:hypothetical protein
MQIQSKCPGCTYTATRRMPTCPMCGALMDLVAPEAKLSPPRHESFSEVIL